MIPTWAFYSEGVKSVSMSRNGCSIRSTRELSSIATLHREAEEDVLELLTQLQAESSCMSGYTGVAGRSASPCLGIESGLHSWSEGCT